MQGLKKWTKIANTIKSQLGIDGKTGKQCRERWQNHLDPNVKKEVWTEEEEKKIFDLQQQLGNKWSEIASFIPGRTENSVKNCFYSAIRRNLRKFNRKKPESEKLKGSVKNLLKKPHVRSLLMGETEELKIDDNSKTGRVKRKTKSNPPERRKSKEEIKLNSTSNLSISKRSLRQKPQDIVCPSISPIPSLNYFSFPITPSTTQSILSTKYNQAYFSFGETNDTSFSNSYKSEAEVQTELSFSECSTPRYYLPHFSPKSTFQHYITPRNSISK